MATTSPPVLSDAQIQIIFSAQTKNVRALNSAWTHLVRTINRDLVSGNEVSLKTHTQLLGLLYCSWAESIFLKLIHTPRGFDGGMINQIQKVKKDNGVFFAWLKCLELGLLKVPAANAAGDIANIRQTLARLIKEYIEEPALLRNKMAHGQWEVALNRENTAINEDISRKIKDIDVVKLMALKSATEIVASCIELLIQSPHMHFRSSIKDVIWEHDQKLAEQSTWTLEEKIAQLKARAPRSRSVGY
ncbi:hypothetical protein CLU92_4192 [Janthinobacterium sp. 61]|uniref:hypothetical protein n=1 Tax=Janthinobacterium sp. 61 TaxID=2035209 RepID=UPI000CB26F03|nr:hypothetical protein [Janthinobacterium sp. 61]PKV46762.1 hypothetical protein CLU92_4192 [Janthinobacterium sp. 61]